MSDKTYYSEAELDKMVEKAAKMRKKRRGQSEDKRSRPESPGQTEMGGEPCPLCGESVLSLPGHLPECDGE